MTPKHLKILKASTTTLDYSFSDKNVDFWENTDVVDALKGLFFGANEGVISLEFVKKNKNYTLVRDCDKKLLSLQEGEKTITDIDFINKEITEFNPIYDKLLEMTDGVFVEEDYQIVDKSEDVITEEVVTEVENNITVEKTANLDEVSIIFDEIESLQKKKSELITDIAELKKQVKLNKELEECETLLKTLYSEKEKMADLQQKTEKAKDFSATNSAVEDYQKLLAKIAELKLEVEPVYADMDKTSNLITEKEELLATYKDKKLSLKSSVETIIKKLTALASRENINYDEQLAPLYEKDTADISLLNKNYEVDSLNYKNISDRIVEVVAQFKEVHANSTSKNAVRKSVILENNINKLNLVKAELINKVDFLTSQKDFISVSSQKMNATLPTDTTNVDTTKEEYASVCKIIDKLNKDISFYNYIENEISAIDIKIKSNKNAIEEYKNDEKALDMAKLSLLEYIKKIEAKNNKLRLSRTDEKAENLYLSEKEALLVGSPCPVCDRTIANKDDLSSLIYDNNREIDKLDSEINKAVAIFEEYSAKKEQVDVKIGELRTRTHTSQVYINSLIDAKNTKTHKLAEILNSNSVKSLDELKDLKNTLVAKSEKCLDSLLVSYKIISNNEVVSYFDSEITPIFDNIDVSIIKANEQINGINIEIATLEKENNKLVSDILPTSGIVLEKTLYNYESQEDSLLRELDILTKDEKEVCYNLNATMQTLLSKTYKDTHIVVDGVGYINKDFIIQTVCDDYNVLIADLHYTREELKANKKNIKLLKKEVSDLNDTFRTITTTIDSLLNKIESCKHTSSYILEKFNLDDQTIKAINEDKEKLFMSEEEINNSTKILESYQFDVALAESKKDLLGLQISDLSAKENHLVALQNNLNDINIKLEKQNEKLVLSIKKLAK